MLRMELDFDEFFIDQDYTADQLKQLGSRSVGAIATIMRNTPRQSIARGRRRHRPSVAGNPPAIDTGRLVGSLSFEATETQLEVGSNVEYAGWLQDGTRHMIARPYLDVGVEKAIREFDEFLADAVDVR